MKIIITGGHLSPALSVVDELKKDQTIVFVGRKYPLDSENTISLEYKEIEKRKIKFYNLSASRFTRMLSAQTFINLFKFPVGFIEAYKILKKEKPDVILSFGGYLGFPICIIAKIFGIPIYIHEQTICPGIVSKITGYFAKQVFISFEETIKYFQTNKVTFTGNPIRKKVLEVIQKPFFISAEKPILYVTGGSLGSHSINILIETILKDLLKNYTVIHQTGNVEEYGDYQRLKSQKERFPQELGGRYFIKDHFMEEELGYIFSKADLVIGRSGANTVFELIAWKKPSILIPLPWSANDEQLEQAKFMSRLGVSELFNQSEPALKLLRLINKVMSEKNNHIECFKSLEYYFKEDAATIIAKAIIKAQK